MFCVHEKTDEVVAISLETKQYTDADIVDAALHCAVHSFSMISVIALRTCWVQCLVVFLVICLLEEDVSADASIA